MIGRGGRFPHHITIARRPAGVAAGAMLNGVWIPTWFDTTITIYDGVGDAQDVQKVLQRGGDGIETVTSDVTIFLPDDADVGTILFDDLVSIAWGDARGTKAGRVMRVRPLDSSIFVQWV